MAVHQARQSGQVTLSGTTATATITAYTLAQSYLTFSYRGGGNTPARGSVRGRKDTTTTLVFDRDGTGGTSPVIEWELSEFDTDVDVQDASRTGNGTVAITAVTLARSFLSPTGSQFGTSNWEGNRYGRWRFNSTTEIEVLQVTATPVHNVQVVDYTGCDVQELEHAITSSTVTSTDDTITAVTVANTLFIASYSSTSGSNDFQDHAWRAQLLNTTTVRFNRAVGASADFTWNHFVIEFTDGTSLQAATHTVADADAQDEITITAVTIAETISMAGGGSGQHWGSHGSNAQADDNTKSCLFTGLLTSTTNLRVQRDASSGACDLYYQVIEWNVAAAAADQEVLHRPKLVESLVLGHLTG